MRRVGRLTAAAVVSAGLVTGCAASQGGTQPAEGAPVVAADEGASSRFHGTLVDPPIERPDLTLQDYTGLSAAGWARNGRDRRIAEMLRRAGAAAN